MTSAEQGQGRNVLEELSDKLQQGRKSRDAVTSQKSDAVTPRVLGVDSGHHDNGVHSAVNYPLLVGSLHLICISIEASLP